jgi:hypothetical protein
MNILSYLRKCCCLVLLCMPQLSYAQKSIEQKVDSMKRAFKRMDSIRRQSGPKDTVKNILIKSPLEIIYHVQKPEVLGIKQLSVQAVRFRHSHYLNLVLSAGLAKPMMVNEQSRLYLISADNQTIILNSMGSGLSKGTEKRNTSELKLTYNLSESDFGFLLSKKIVSVRMEYAGGEWVLNIGSEGA